VRCPQVGQVIRHGSHVSKANCPPVTITGPPPDLKELGGAEGIRPSDPLDANEIPSVARYG
jgi:hypothetical protein